MNKSNKKVSLRLIIIFALTLILWLITSVNQTKYINLWFFIISTLSVFFIMKNKSITKLDIITGVVLGLISMPSNVFRGVISIIAYLGGVSVFKNSENKIRLIKSTDKKDLFTTITLIIVGGGILGLINFYTAKNMIPINPSFKLKWFLDAVRAGAVEEIIFRFFFFAICIYFTNDKVLSKFDNFMCYLIMIVPHTLLHFDRTSFNLAGLIILSLLFGLPFAIMQRKHDLTSAIGAHATVDLIRFIVFGT